MLDAAPFPLGAAHLEEIGKIRAEGDLQLDTAVHLAEIPDAQPLVAGGVQQEARPSDMKEIVLQEEPPAPVEEIGVGEVEGKGGIVIPPNRKSVGKGKSV